MKIMIYQSGKAPFEIVVDRIQVTCGRDMFELREHSGLLTRIEEHDGSLTADLALFPYGSNGVLLKGGMR